MAEASGARPVDRPAAPAGRFPARLAVAALSAVLAALTCVFAMARPAAAEAFLVAATPSHGATVQTAPQEVLLTFSEPVDVVGDGVAVVGPDGDRVDPGTVRRPRPEVVSVPLPGVVSITRQGTYTVAWHVVSVDSRPARGSFSFTIGTPRGATGVTAAGPAPAVAAAYGVAAFAALAGLGLLAGGVVLGGRYGGPAAGASAGTPAGASPGTSSGPRRLVMAGWPTLVAATLALLVLRGPYAAGAGLVRVADGDLLGQTLHSGYGRALAVRLVVVGAVPALLMWGAGRMADRRRRGRVEFAMAGLVAAVCLALTWTAVGDAATAGSPALVAAVVQLLATATWLGCLVAVPFALRAAPPPEPQQASEPLDPEPPDPEPPATGGGGAAGGVATSAKTAPAPVARAPGLAVVARRFGPLTAICPVVIVITGGYLERHAVGGAAELVTTAYGRLLVAKVVLLGAALALAVPLARRLRAADPAGARRIALAGPAVAALILAVTTALAEVRPAAQAQASRPATASARFTAGAGPGSGAGPGVLDLRLPRTLRGVDEAELTVLAGGGPLDLPGLQAAWTHPALGIGPLPVRFTRVGTGRYRLAWPPLPVAGGWRMRITSGGGSAAAFSVRIR